MRLLGTGLAEGGSGTDIITAKDGYIRVAGEEEGMRRTARGRDAGSSDDVSANVSVWGRNSREGRLAGEQSADWPRRWRGRNCTGTIISCKSA